MSDSFGSDATPPPTIAPAIVASRSWMARVRRPLILALATLGAVLICSAHAAVANANTVRASGVGYLCLTLVLLGCSMAFWTRARLAKGSLYVRWSMISAAALTASIGYVPSFTEAVFNTQPARQIQTICFNTSEALYMLAAVLFFAGVARSIVLLDMLQGFLFVVMRFNLIYSPVTRDHFSANHLIIGQLMAFFLFVVAVVGCMGAASHAELKFLRTVAWFFGLRFLAFFLANEVSYTWLHYGNCSLWDVPGPALLAGFALYLLYTSRIARTLPTTPIRSSVTVRSMIPSFLALVNLMLGILLLSTSLSLAAGAISVSLLCYVVRTALLQAQAVREKAMLESRNEQLEGLAIRDPLTGIGNRRSLAGVHGDLQAEGADERLSLLLMDIDYFKQANDCHGHLHGDKVLVALARKLDNLAAGVAGSHCARFGGDEFAVLLPGVSPQLAATLAEELRAHFSADAFSAEMGNVSLSIGVASLHTAQDLPLETLISYADKALYRAKLLGRNRVEAQPVWEPDAVLPTLCLELQHETR